ncbi:phosphopentomutase [Orbus sturtevantii]|uniref:phosphopentomutase n=1 Tax=Orbus sturtevantii TaxID=3074109 RepID=UPI00370D6416
MIQMTPEKKGKCIVIILDGFGIGCMDDVSEVRPRDIHSNTALNIIKRNPSIELPNLENLGLMNAIGCEYKHHKFSLTANWGTANLAHVGADSFLGHQEIIGTLPKPPLIEPFRNKIDIIEKNLKNAGYGVRRVGKQLDPKILVINECVTVGDNLETDYGQVYNVTACLDLISFEDLKKLASIVRGSVQVSRVITFGGENITLQDLLNARKVKNNAIAGIDAPLSGVYKKGYKVIHLGYGIDKNVQIPTILDKSSIDVCLIGKAADIIQTDSKKIIYGVDSDYLFDQLNLESTKMDTGLIILNIQETDLAGHSQDVQWYSELLQLADKRIGTLIAQLRSDDILIIMADHGNDPTIGHSNHTREKVPLLAYKKGVEGKHLGTRATLSDVGATVAEYFNVEPPQNGVSFLSQLF